MKSGPNYSTCLCTNVQWVIITHPVITHTVTESECSMQVHKPKLREFCTKLLAQSEGIILCAMSTHSDPQLLPYIQVLTLLGQLHSLAGLLHMHLYLPFLATVATVVITYHLPPPYVLSLRSGGRRKNASHLISNNATFFNVQPQHNVAYPA